MEASSGRAGPGRARVGRRSYRRTVGDMARHQSGDAVRITTAAASRAARHRGPAAPLPAARWASAPCASWRAIFVDRARWARAGCCRRRRLVLPVRRGGDGQRRRIEVRRLRAGRTAPTGARELPGGIRVRRPVSDQSHHVTIRAEPCLPVRLVECRTASPVAVRHRFLRPADGKACRERTDSARRRAARTRPSGAALEQPEAPHPRPPQDLAGVRRAPRVSWPTSWVRASFLLEVVPADQAPRTPVRAR